MLKDRLKEYISFKDLSIREFERICDFPNGTVNALGDSISPKRKKVIVEKFPTLNIVWLLTGIGEKEIDEEKKPVNPTKEEALKKLKEVKSKNGHKEPDRILDASGLVRQKVITIPIPGFAGLQQHFFSEDYIEQNFVEEEVLVRPEEKITDPYYRIQVKGNNYSMFPTLLPLEWVWCEPISEMFWNDPKTFKKERIYCLWHHTKGILYKRISKYKQGMITLSSDNENKDDYPDQDFFIGEFKRIFLIRKKEVEL